MTVKIHDNHIMNIYYNVKSAGRFQYSKKKLQIPPGSNVSSQAKPGSFRSNKLQRGNDFGKYLQWQVMNIQGYPYR